MMKLTNFGLQVRKLRLEINETQKDMALKLGVKQSTLSSMESGRRNVSDEMIDKIVAIYHLPKAQAAKLYPKGEPLPKSVNVNLQKCNRKQRTFFVDLGKELYKLTDDDLKTIGQIVKRREKSSEICAI